MQLIQNKLAEDCLQNKLDIKKNYLRSFDKTKNSRYTYIRLN